MSQTFRLTLAQLNPTVGAIVANIALALEAWEQGRAAGAQMVALTEMFVTGYQTQDLILKPAFAAHAERVVADLARQIVDGPALGIGGPLTRDGQLYNAYYILEGGKIAATVLKHELPNDGVFDEKRLFASAPLQGPYRVGPLRIGSPICGDLVGAQRLSLSPGQAQRADEPDGGAGGRNGLALGVSEHDRGPRRPGV